MIILGLLLCCTLCVVAVQSYQSANTGRLLAEAFFDAQPPNGYGTQRVLTPVPATDAAASILRQGIRYHQEAKYDLALVSFRAYFADNPIIEDAQPASLAASAAFASGAYAETNRFIGELPADNVTKMWLQALLELREENLVAAESLLSQLKNRTDNPYPAAALLDRLP